MPKSPALRNLAIAALCLGFFVLLTSVYRFIPRSTAPLSISLEPLTANAMLSKRNVAQAFDGAGVVMLDSCQERPGIPYLAFEDSSHHVEFKELVFSGRGCDPNAGNLPCMPNIGESGDMRTIPPVPAGTPLAVQGGIVDQAIYVSSYEPLSAVPADMQIVNLGLNQSMTLQDGTVMTPVQYFTDPSCTLGVGCVGYRTRVEMEMHNRDGTGTSTTELVQGGLFFHHGFAVVLLGISPAPETGGSTFLVARNGHE